MIGSFITRGLALVLGYAYPAYECFKTVELNKPEVEQLRFWCQYWILVAALTVFERVGESLISWLPMYSEAKVAFFVYLWYPKTRGTAYVYDTFFRPYIAKHETEIDRNLYELRTRAGDMVVLYSQRIVTYGQTRIFEILQYVASQSQQPSRPHPQQRQQARQTTNASTRQPPAPPQVQQVASASPQVQQAAPAPPQVQQVARPPSAPASPSRSRSLSGKAGPAPTPSAPPLPTVVEPSRSTSLPSSWEIVPSPNSPGAAEAMQVEVSSAPSKNDANPPPPEETPMEEAIRVTRGRLRKRAAAAAPETR